MSDSRLAVIVLAAGTSSRWGRDNKLLASIDGQPMIRRAVESALDAGVGPVIVVTGHDATSIRMTLAGMPVSFAHAADYALGMSASLKAGIAAAPADCGGVLVCLGDMPFVSVATFRRLAGAFDANPGSAAWLPAFDGQRGNPVLLGRILFPEIRDLTGDQGARRLLTRHAGNVLDIAVDDPGVLRDLDRPEALDG